MNNNHHNSKGFVILFTILISSIILVIAAGVFSISYKESILSSAAKESAIAIYAADSGVECALYLAYHPALLTPGTSFDCFGSSVTLDTSPSFSSVLVFESSLSSQYNSSSPAGYPCVIVSIETPAVCSSGSCTKIISNGYNICQVQQGQIGPATSDPLLLERVFQVDLPLAAAPTTTTSPAGGTSPLTTSTPASGPGLTLPVFKPAPAAGSTGGLGISP